MARSFKFAVLQAVPDERRGERVNIGMTVFQDDGLDVRLSEVSKLKALTGRDWDLYLSAFRERAIAIGVAESDDEQRLAALRVLEPVVLASDFGWFDAANNEEYELHVSEILSTLVSRPSTERKPSEPRINTEIALEFRKHKILAKKGDDLFSHKVVRNVPFTRHHGLKADFVLKNGIYHVTATLDLRKINVRLDEACFKAVVLDKARDEFDGEKKLFGVYAASKTDVKEYRDHIELLGDYSDELFNWLDWDQQVKYQRRMYDALDRIF